MEDNFNHETYFMNDEFIKKVEKSMTNIELIK